ncbi:MAG: sodium-dependent transporter [Endomicrobium sp.]|jgi:NSS family neurotransmitter:Na+ symporter|nr:sodium-dependent transporter [Endomicrobium sp.]
MNAIKDSFSGKWGLIFAAAGSAIGLGNIWLFPYRLGESGGATFMIPYIICLSIIGVIAVIGEITIGRLTGTGPVGAFKKALELRGKNGKAGEAFGWICVLVALVQAIAYILVVSWVVRFLAGSFTGAAFKASNSAHYFNVVEHTHVFLWIGITVFIAAVTIVKGIEKGIEKCCTFMIPAIIILLLFLAIRVAFLPNALEGYKYLFTPRWECLFDTRVWMLALGQVFYSLSLRGSTVVVYGSYANKNDDIVSSAKNIVVLDTIASIIASLLIIPAVFAFGENLNSGESLMFITMPNIFKDVPLGQFLMTLFFIAVFFAALTSLIGMLEVIVEVLQNKFKISRIWAVGVISVLAAVMCNFFVVGNIRGVMDILELHLIPICTLACGIFIFWIVPRNKVIEEIQSGHPKPLGKWIIPMGRYVFCSIVILLYILNILKSTL